MTIPNSPEVQRTLDEAKALGALLACVTKTGPCDDLLALVGPVFDRHTPQDAESWLRHLAMARLLGRDVELPDLEPTSEATSQLFVRTARAWMLWAMRRPEEAKAALRATVCEPARREPGGEIHMMALGSWCLGVGALLRDDQEEARRYFRRSTEVGSQLGTETNNAIQWAFVATFFDHEALRNATS